MGGFEGSLHPSHPSHPSHPPPHPPHPYPPPYPPPSHRHDGVRHGLWQERVVDMVVDKGASVFISGMAGSGKTFVLERIIRMLKSKHGVNFCSSSTMLNSTNHLVIPSFNE
jgi:hypothetical protein